MMGDEQMYKYTGVSQDGTSCDSDTGIEGQE